MNDHLPPPPPGVPGRDTPPPYVPPTPTWPQSPPPWPPVAGVPTMNLLEDDLCGGQRPPKRSATPLLVILGMLAVLLAGVILGALARGGNDPADTAAPAPVPPTTAAPVYRETTTTLDSVTDRELQELALDSTWDDTSYSDQRSVCQGVDVFGVDGAADLLIEGADGAFDRDIVERKLVEWCNRY